MKIYIIAKTNAHEDKIEKIDESHYKISTTELPVRGRANLSIIELLAEFFNIPKTNITIVSGYKSKNKIFEISE